MSLQSALGRMDDLAPWSRLYGQSTQSRRVHTQLRRDCFAGWLGFHLAGTIAMILFAPLGAIGGLILGIARPVDILEFVGDFIKNISL
ncbi:hypothetical protein [Rhizobium sp. BK376]|uniref:hypothetical protein n=1 Tax=Rhizobium sp. BK376 TaxID=2512149 RepID=UPI00104AD069|nr:hypothetical protein [Rhizobium sp. BK376]TCR83662.1 hypothetical protein EV561_109194 [Rhizobium sp. BK376]